MMDIFFVGSYFRMLSMTHDHRVKVMDIYLSNLKFKF